MSPRNRRQFLEDSMFATAAAVAGGATAIGGQPDRSPRAASERLGVAVVGARGRGNTHIATYAARRDTQLLYVCDPDVRLGEKRAAQATRRQGGRFAVQHLIDFREALADPRVDVVSIATPHHWHALSAIWAMRAGKDVYVEKPGSHCLAEGRQVLETVRRTQQICQVGLQSRSNLGIRSAMRFLHEGGLGELLRVRGLCYKRRSPIGPAVQGQPPAELEYQLWLGPAPDSLVTRQRFHHDWHWQWDYGGGELANQGMHQLDLARWGLNVNSHADNVISFGGRFGQSDAGQTANTQTVIQQVKGAEILFEVRGLPSKRVRGAKVGVIFEGSGGFLVVASYSSAVAFDRHGNTLKTFTGGGDHFANFLGAVRSRRSEDLHANMETAHYSSSLCHLGNISYRLGNPRSAAIAEQQLGRAGYGENAMDAVQRIIQHLNENSIDGDTPIILGPRLEFDSAREQFVDNLQADSMLTINHRQPFVISGNPTELS